jgi:hypothetical protein
VNVDAVLHRAETTFLIQGISRASLIPADYCTAVGDLWPCDTFKGIGSSSKFSVKSCLFGKWIQDINVQRTIFAMGEVSHASLIWVQESQTDSLAVP